MNFFQAQDNARRNTWQLLLLFLSAVAATVAVVYIVLHFGLHFSGRADPALDLQAVNYELLITTAVGVMALVCVGSLYKILQLSGGGERVAQSMGGRLLLSSTRDPDERKLLNIVEEMSIAAGAPMPLVYLLPDDNINAFAAGTTPSNAVIGMTRGALKILNREQMQGVVAHEFSHIINGDMRLNIRLIAIIHGIMLLGYLGYFILRGSLYSSFAGHRSRGGGGGQAGLMLAGVGLVVAGAAGTFFGSWIRAAVSRQREYLADAAAVQYTRYPQGIAGALERIGQLSGAIKSGADNQMSIAHKKRQLDKLGHSLASGEAENKHAIEYSHMFFSNAVAVGFANPFATHPPLDKRIKRILPQWSGEQLINTDAPVDNSSAVEATSAGFAASAGIEQIGTINAAAIQCAATAMKKTPLALARACEDAYSARALIYAILLDKKHQHFRDAQLAHIKQHADEGVYDYVIKLMPEVNMLRRTAIVPLVQRALPALRLLSPRQYQLFLGNMAALVEADNAIELFEWCIQAVIVHALHDHFSKHPRAALSGDKNAAMAYALSMLARVSQEQPAAAVAGAVKSSGLALSYSERDFIPQELFDAMQQLSNMAPKKKEQFVRAAVACAAHNGNIDVNEAVLLRTYLMIVDCSLPLAVMEN